MRKEFIEALENHGGLITAEDILQHSMGFPQVVLMQWLLRDFPGFINSFEISTSHSKVIHNLDIVIFRSGELNGFSKSIENDHLIAVSAGYLLKVTDLIFNIIALPDVLCEVKPVTSYPSLFSLAFIDSWVFNEKSKRVIPFFSKLAYSEFRLDLAKDLSWLAVTYLIYHEMSHILCGHTRYIRNYLGCSVENDIFHENIAAYAGSHSQLFEIEADLQAVAMGAQLLIEAYSNGSFQYLAEFYDCTVPFFVIAKLWTIAVYTVHTLWEQCAPDISSRYSSTHMHPVNRSLLCIDHFIDYIYANNDRSKFEFRILDLPERNDFIVACYNSISDIVHIKESVGLKDSIFSLLQGVCRNDVEATSAISEIVTQFKKVRQSRIIEYKRKCHLWAQYALFIE